MSGSFGFSVFIGTLFGTRESVSSRADPGSTRPSSGLDWVRRWIVVARFVTGFAARVLQAADIIGHHARVLSKPFKLTELVAEVDAMVARTSL